MPESHPRSAAPAALGVALATTLAVSCATGGGAARVTTALDAPAGPLSVLAEGLCPKLGVYAVGDRSFLVFGTHGLDATAFALGASREADVTAAQSFVELRGDDAVRDPAWLVGLPTTLDGFVPGDVELGGLGPEAMWLMRVETGRGERQRGVLYERRRLYYAWTPDGFRLDARARDAATQGMRAPEPPLAELCTEEGLSFATYAADRLPSGDVIVAGRCEDERKLGRGGLRIASFFAGDRRFHIDDAPASPLFDQIVNAEIVFVSRSEAYLYAYPPYARDEASPAYVARFDGERWSLLDLPFPGPVVSLAAADDGTLWAIAGWRQLHRAVHGRWERVPVPRPVFVEPSDVALRLLDVRAVAGAVWLHAAYPVELAGSERAAGRGHVLYTTRPVSRPLHCDRRRPAAEALGEDGESLRGAAEIR